MGTSPDKDATSKLTTGMEVRAIDIEFWRGIRGETVHTLAYALEASELMNVRLFTLQVGEADPSVSRRVLSAWFRV